MKLYVALAQINPCVGAVWKNFQKIVDFWERAEGKAHMVVFPELSICGYPPEDLLLRKDFIEECRLATEKLVELSKSMSCLLVVGAPYYDGDLYNGLLLIGMGKILGVYKKRYLPQYSVFDEKRYFRAGSEPLLVEVGGVKIGFSIGWERFYALNGAHVLVNINASPYHMGKQGLKESLLKVRAFDNTAYVVYVNMVGGQDELVFDGRSLVIDPEGRVLARAKAFEEDMIFVELDTEKVERIRLLESRLRQLRVEKAQPVHIPMESMEGYAESRVEEVNSEEEEIYRALLLAIRDYTEKNAFEKVVLGLSGGIDSSLVACLAVDALGKERVVGVFMPSEYTSRESEEDVKALAENLQIQLLTYPIREVYESYLKLLHSEGLTVAEENLQSRIRANILFYLSNRYGWLVLSTSNKSESAVGYSTIYGDMAGGFAPIKDLYKGWVYRLARYRNSIKPDIPERVFTKPPSAELRPGQTDQDSLPPYHILDRILELYIEEGLSAEEIASCGFESELVRKVIGMVKRAEYKRRQAPVGPKLTKRAFGKDWRMPISSFYP